MDMNESDYRNILRSEFSQRRQHNPSYSLRAFARDLALSSSRLSEVLNGKQGLSRSSAQAISDKLHFTEKEKMYFCELVDSLHARSILKKKMALHKIESLKSEKDFFQLQADTFKIISDWYHLAIIELIGLPGFKYNHDWIAKRLGISKIQVQDALTRLKRAGLISEGGGKIEVKAHFTSTRTIGTPQEYIRKYHKQLLEKALSALFTHPIEERDFGGLIVSVKKEKIPEAKKMLKEFRLKFCEVMNQVNEHDEVYALTTQFFQLTTQEAKL